MKRAQLMIAVISMTLLGCPSVHTMRGAEVLPSETSEVVTHVGMNGILTLPPPRRRASLTARPGGFALGGVLVPFGLGNNMDFQVKTDLGLFPGARARLSVRRRAGSGQPAVSAYWVLRRSAGAGDSSGSVLYAPLTLLADLPLGENKVTVKGGFMLISASGGGSSTAAATRFWVSAGVKLGGRRSCLRSTTCTPAPSRRRPTMAPPR